METRVVDNRTFLLGLDELYRDAIQDHESHELLAAARAVAGMLRVAPAQVPVEGYYAEREDLTEYFLLMRALQNVENSRVVEVEHTAEYARLYDVTSSSLFGRPQNEDKLLPVGRDALSRALWKTPVLDWSVAKLTAAARRQADDTNDCSLVGLAAYAEDSVVLAALRESVVLYAEMWLGALSREMIEEPHYEWRVDPILAERATQFIDTFNRLFPSGWPLPAALPKNASAFWRRDPIRGALGRCVRLGSTPTEPQQYYHWAIRIGSLGAVEVDAFWSPEIWTTQGYKQSDRFLRPHSVELS